ncbi:MAG: hypothetical protein GX868_03930 [Actinobacteria bacterium]|nr:hypothetical protein [Actinomycetota bacterium]
MTRGTCRTRFVGALVAALSVAGACSSNDADGSGGDTGAVEVTTTEATERSAAFAERGPYSVGTMSLTLGDGRRAVVWYPAAPTPDAESATENFDIAALLSAELQSKIPDSDRPRYPIGATSGAAAADDGPYPVVLFSHGYAGFPEQSADLVTHLASWGMVVAAPDHVERSLGGLLGPAAQGVEPSTDPAVLSAALDAVIAEAGTDGSPIRDLVDAERVAVGGHSAGAAAAFRTASTDERIDGFISYSVGYEGLMTPRDGGAPAAIPAVPGVVMLGSIDDTIPAESSRSLYAAMTAPKALVEIADSGHLVFSDICLIGRDQGGLAGLVRKVGLDLPENILKLATDGCQPEALAAENAFDAIDHLSVSFFRWVFGEEDTPVGFDQETIDRLDSATVTVTAQFG